MVTVVIVIHILIAASLIILILLQKNEGNAAGGGFSVSSASAMMQPRARSNPLSRATAILGLTFFVTSMGLALLAKQNGPVQSIITEPVSAQGKAPRVDEVQVPSSSEPAAPAAASPAPTGKAPEVPSAPPAVPTTPKD